MYGKAPGGPGGPPGYVLCGGGITGEEVGRLLFELENPKENPALGAGAALLTLA